jgi:chromatin segregation and condensation protein Rec8/ScpA/Scc1 (kleisin family)
VAPAASTPALPNVTLDELRDSLEAALARPGEAPEDSAPLPGPTVEQFIDRIRDALRGGEPVSFAALAPENTTLADVVAAFLAILELFRRQELEIEQGGLFGAILLRGLQPAA